MAKDVIINIRSYEEGDGEPEVVDFTTDGKMTSTSYGYCIVYHESELTGMEGTTTTIRVEETPRLTLSRRGTVSARMTFEKDKRNLTAYNVEQGQLTIGLYTFDLSQDIGPKGGSIHVGYTVEFDSHVAGVRTLDVTVRAKDSNQITEIS